MSKAKTAKPDFIIKDWNENTKKMLDGQIGVYAFVLITFTNKRHYIYVGGTQNLTDRISSHFSLKNISKLFKIVLRHFKEEYARVEVEIYFCKENNIFETEQEYISLLKPTLNFSNRWYLTPKWIGKYNLSKYGSKVNTAE